MAKTHRVLRRISGVDHLTPGDLVDVTGWKLLDKLVDQRYLEKLTDAEIAALAATEAAKIERSSPPAPALLAAASPKPVSPAAPKQATHPAKPKQA